MKPPGVARLGAISAIVLISAAVLSPVPFRMEPITEMTFGDAKIALRHLRAVFDDRGGKLSPLDLPSLANDEIPLVLTVWRNGARWRVFQSAGKPFAEAIRELEAKLVNIRAIAHSSEDRFRLELDCAVAEGWAPENGLLFALSFVEGWTGVSGVIGGERVYVSPSELIRNQRYGSFAPLPGFDPRFRIGLSTESASRAVANQARSIGNKSIDKPTALARFTSFTVVEGDDLAPLALRKGTVERPALTRKRLDAAIRSGARYLVHSLEPDGLYRYLYDPLKNKDVEDAYNWPRHAGTSYALSLVGRLDKEDEYIDASARALTRFEQELGDGPNGTRCLVENRRCYLGSTALGLLALSEHRIASGDTRFEKTARALAAFLISMQREDGFFFHDWHSEKGIDRTKMKLYASQQAVFALARYARAFGDREALKSAERGMDYLAGPYWDHFLGTYFFGQEHWSCLAAEEMYAAIPKPEYASFCLGIGVNYDRLCHAPKETPYVEDVGGMSITHMFTPHIGGTATAAEAMVSAVVLGHATNADVDAIEAQLGWTFAFLEKGQLTRDDLFWIPSPENALGGMLESQTKMNVRIDNVQHAISAMVRGRDYIFHD